MLRIINPEHLFISSYWMRGSPERFEPGMLLELKDGKLVLVGHVNKEDGGSCGCCSEFFYNSDKDSIKRWIKVVDFYY